MQTCPRDVQTSWQEKGVPGCHAPRSLQGQALTKLQHCHAWGINLAPQLHHVHSDHPLAHQPRGMQGATADGTPTVHAPMGSALAALGPTVVALTEPGFRSGRLGHARVRRGAAIHAGGASQGLPQ